MIDSCVRYIACIIADPEPRNDVITTEPYSEMNGVSSILIALTSVARGYVLSYTLPLGKHKYRKLCLDANAVFGIILILLVELGFRLSRDCGIRCFFLS